MPTLGKILTGAATNAALGTFMAHAQGKETNSNFLKDTLKNALPALLISGMSGPAGFMTKAFMTGVPMIAGMATGVMGAVEHRNQFIRQVTTPFSQRFEHTEASFQAQQYGMQSINRARSLIGSEGAMMAARYGRR